MGGPWAVLALLFSAFGVRLRNRWEWHGPLDDHCASYIFDDFRDCR